MTCWWIWFARYRKIFEDMEPDIISYIAWLIASLRDWNRLLDGHIINSQEDLLILHNLGIGG